MDTTTAGLPVDGLDVRLADMLGAGALMSVVADEAAVAEAAVDGALDSGQSVRLGLGAAAASVSRADFVRLLATELELGRCERQPRRPADVEDQIEAELARREQVLVVVHGAHRMLTESLEWLYSIWSRASTSGTHLSVVLTASPRLDRILARPALADLRSCLLIQHRISA
ncbi:AAA family ATPase [Streptomyces sp. NPDC051546]|uniref:AAA family ATPase n=1 Tax=Streptomyces sp. NPDC051546 TaxID=3365655 RepID=UPI0037967DCC